MQISQDKLSGKFKEEDETLKNLAFLKKSFLDFTTL